MAWRFGHRLKALAATDRPELRAYAGASWPDARTPFAQIPLLAVDFELDGLARDAHVLQAGWIGFDASGIPLAQAESHDVRSQRRLDDRAVAVHGIGEDRARSGVPVETMIVRLIRALAGQVMVAHGAAIERGVIARLSKAHFGVEIPVRSICTLKLERRLNPNLVGTDAYRLAATRSRYNLPDFPQHDALSDALGAAELLLAQLSRMGPDPGLGAIDDW